MAASFKEWWADTLVLCLFAGLTGLVLGLFARVIALLSD